MGNKRFIMNLLFPLPFFNVFLYELIYRIEVKALRNNGSDKEWVLENYKKNYLKLIKIKVI